MESMESGFGVRVDGMVGMEDPGREWDGPPGEGKRGAISGDISVCGEIGGSGNTAGVAEIVSSSRSRLIS